MKRKLLSILLCLAMALSLLPTAALAVDETTGAGTITVGGTPYSSFSDAVDAAEPDENGVITYEISGKVEVDSTEAWIQVLGDDLSNVTVVKFVGVENSNAEICIQNPTSVLADQKYDIDVSFENLKLSHPNGVWADDRGHATKFFTCWLRNTDQANNIVTYTNCTFPNGVCNNQYGKTVFYSCQFTNSANYNLWNYGGNTEVKDSTFRGARGIKAYSEGADGGDITVADTTFTNLTEKAAIVVSKATDITLTDVTATGCTMGLLQKDIEGSEDAQKVTIEANGTDISGEFNITAEKDAEAAKNEFNISGGTFTSEVEQDYCKDGFEVKVGEGGKYTVEKSDDVAKIGEQGYTSLAKAIETANQTEGNSNVTVTITKSGSYDPFTITRANVTVEAADGVTATINVSEDKTGNINATNVTLKGLNFVSTDGTTIFSSGDCDNLTLDGCTFTGTGTGTALYIHQPNITIQDCVFEDFAYAYDTCGDNHAAGKITITGNAFNNIRVPINGYWGKTATGATDIQITGNIFDNGDWDAAYIQLWDYAQYLKWAGNKDTDRQGSAIKATIQNNTYVGDVVIYATHFDWFYKSNLTTDPDAQGRVKYRVLVELDGADSATVTNKDGSDITAFNESTQSSKRGEKQVIYSICEGDYIFNIKPTGATEAVLSQPVTVSKPESLGDTSEVTVPAEAVNVAQVGNEKYTTLAEAIQAAKNGGTVELLSNISIGTWNQVWDTKNMTIKGNGHTITIGAVESGVNGNYLFYGAKDLNVSDLTINFTTNGNGFSMVSGKLEKVNMYGGPNSNYAVFVGASTDEADKVEISNCLFDGFKGAAVYSQPAANGKTTSDISVNKTTFTNCGMTMCSYAQNTVFTNNSVTDGSEVSFAAGAENENRDNTYTITGNTFKNAGKIWFYDADLADVTFTKNKVLGNTTVSTEQAKADTKLNVSENYWGGNAPGNKVNGSNITGSDIYYVRPTMKPSDLNTYVPPTTGGGSVSGDYIVSVDSTTGGKVTVNPGRADKGDTVTITVKPNEGYELGTLTVTDKNGKTVKVTSKGNDKYTFTMPDSKVTVEATFVKIDAGSVLDDFTDVNPNAWYAEAVEFVVEEGLMTGTSSTTFAPDTSMSRAMIWTVLAAYNDYNTSGGNPWYAPGQQWAMVNGVSDGTSPNGSITREQLAVMLWRAAGSPETSKSLSGYADASSVSDWAVEALAWAVDNGIISGMGGSSLAPQTTATRAQVAVMLMQFVDYMEG